jgi:hypothetical protein
MNIYGVVKYAHCRVLTDLISTYHNNYGVNKNFIYCIWYCLLYYTIIAVEQAAYNIKPETASFFDSRLENIST